MVKKNPRIIRKYKNRKLYDTTSSKYVTLDELAEMLKKGDDISVVGHETNEDLTSLVLSEILYDQEKNKKSVLPLELLTNIIKSKESSNYGFMKKFIGLNQDNNEENKVASAERYIEGLIEKGELTTGEGKSLLKELLQSEKDGLEALENKIDAKVSEKSAQLDKFDSLQNKVADLTSKLNQLEKKITKY